MLTIEAVLGTDQCFDQLAAESVGRVVFSQGALPAITPSLYALCESGICFVTGLDKEQHAGIGGSVVAFEVDCLDPVTSAGWAVVVTGVAEPCTRPGRQRLAAAAGLQPSDDAWHTVFWLIPEIVTGRRFGPTCAPALHPN